MKSIRCSLPITAVVATCTVWAEPGSSIFSAATSAASGAPAPSSPDHLETRDRPFGTEPWGPEVFRDRRRRLMEQMKSGVGLILSSSGKEGQDAAEENNFFYLTGLAEEAGAALLLMPQDPRREELFLKESNPERDRWTGYRAMLPNRALESRIGFAHIFRTPSLGGRLAALAERWHDLHFFGPIVGYDSDLPKVLDIYDKTTRRVPGTRVKDSTGLVAKMRTIKEPREIEKIAKATEITIEAHLEAMRRVHPGMREWDLKHIVEEAFRQRGARDLSYSSIVGAGPDSSVLHYLNDDRLIRDGELVLIDAAARFDHYASDVTRTFPANGKFTAEQRRIYKVVLASQEAALARLRAGVTWDELDEAAAKVIADAGYYDYFIHRVGHFVGLDVHDVGSRTEPILENSVITVEPGIYIPEQNLGIRIEDVVLVTSKGYQILSGKLPRDPDAVEKLMAGGRR